MLGKWSVLRRRHRKKSGGLGNHMWELKTFLEVWAFMQIVFPKDLGKIFKLKYCRWLCMDFLFSSICMSHSKLSDFFVSAICQPVRPSWAGWLVKLILWGHPYRSLWQSSHGHRSGTPAMWRINWGRPPCDLVVRDVSVWRDPQGHLMHDMAVRDIWDIWGPSEGSCAFILVFASAR